MSTEMFNIRESNLQILKSNKTSRDTIMREYKKERKKKTITKTQEYKKNKMKMVEMIVNGKCAPLPLS